MTISSVMMGASYASTSNTSSYSSPNTIVAPNIISVVGRALEDVGTFRQATAHNHGLTTPLQVRSLSVCVMPSFFQDFYFKVHVTPNPVNLGNILSTVEQTFYIWNAHFVSSTITSISELATNGLQITTQEGAILYGLGEGTYVLKAFTSGSPEVNAKFTFNMSTNDTAFLSVTGQRVIVFPFPPDWTKDITTSYSWHTDIITTFSGNEQRIQLLQKPRFKYSYSVYPHQKDKRSFDTILNNWMYRKFSVPLWHQPMECKSPSLAGDFTINVDTDFFGLQTGMPLAIVVTGKIYPVTIVGFTSTVITLTLALSIDVPLGAKVYPMVIASLPNKVTTKFVGRSTVTSSLEFSADVAPDTSPVDVVETYRGKPLLLAQPNYNLGLSTEFSSETIITDNEISAVTVQVKSDQVVSTTGFSWTSLSNEQHTKLLSWFYSRVGMQKPTWVCSWQEDLKVIDTSSIHEQSLIVENIGMSRHLINKINRRDIIVWYIDNTYQTFRILDIFIDTNSEVLSLDSGVNRNVTPNGVAMVCYLEYKRLGSDSVSFKWDTPCLSSVSHSLVGVIDDV